MRAGGFEVLKADARQALALQLLPCLAHPDPLLREQVAFEALSQWIGARLLTPRTVNTILARLMPQIAPDHPDPEGFAQPFAALVLSEIAGLDRSEPFISPEQLMQLSTAASAYMRSVRDYRGFEDQTGWRHAVAHDADLLSQLSVNPRIGKEHLDEMLRAIAVQIAPAGQHFYKYGEPERLARAVFFIMQRKLHSPEEWTSWFEHITDPAPLTAWDEAYSSQQGLSRRHNTMAFMQALYVYLNEHGAEFKDRAAGALAAGIRRLN